MPRALTLQHRLVAGSTILFFWGALLALPDRTGGLTLDDSWEQGLAVLFQRGAWAGKDYIFTYGPLGYFMTSAYNHDLFWQKVIWEAVVKLAMAVSFAAVLGRLGSVGSKVLLAVLCVVMLGQSDRYNRDAAYAMFVLCLTFLSLDQPALSLKGLSYVLLMAVLAQVKFTLFIVVGLHILVRSAYLACSRRIVEGLYVLALFVLIWMGIWLALGQPLESLPAYFQGSWQITAGFADAMAMESPDRGHEVYLALVILLLLVLGWFTLDWRGQSQAFVWATAVLLGASLFWEWKQGFTRHDGLHARLFFSFVPLVPFIVAARFSICPTRRTAAHLITGAVIFLSLLGMNSAANPPTNLRQLAWQNFRKLPQSLGQLMTPWRLRQHLDSQEAARAEYQLPKIRAEVGDASVDFLCNLQSYLLANQLQWRPRPIFQSYSAYTAPLQEANAAFLRSDARPEYLMLVINPIDGRLPSSEDAPALIEILQHYHPVLIEKGILLVKKNTPSRTSRENPDDSFPIRLDVHAHFGETIAIDTVTDTYQTLSVGIRMTPWGRLRSVFFRPASLFLFVKTSEGRELKYRLIPSMTSNGIILNPLVTDGLDLLPVLHLYGLPGATRVSSLRVSGPDQEPSSYDPDIHLTLRACPPPPCPALTPERVSELMNRH
jgi:hypothetical protein